MAEAKHSSDLSKLKTLEIHVDDANSVYMKPYLQENYKLSGYFCVFILLNQFL